MAQPRRAPASVPLDRERIVAAALDRIDRTGLNEFSVRVLARDLGVYPTAVSWHVGTRAELLAEVVSLALKDVTPPRRRRWQDWVRELMSRYRNALHRHPNVAPLLSAQLVSNAGVSMEIADALVGVLSSAGFEGKSLVRAHNAILGAMIGWVGLELAPQSLSAGGAAEAIDRLRDRLDNLDPASHAALLSHREVLFNKAFVLRWESGATNPLDDSFNAFVHALVAGIGVMLARSRHPDSEIP